VRAGNDTVVDEGLLRVPDVSSVHAVLAPHPALNSWAPYSALWVPRALDQVNVTVEAPVAVTWPYQISSSVVPVPENCTPLVQAVTPPPEMDDTVGVVVLSSAKTTSRSPTVWGDTANVVRATPCAEVMVPAGPVTKVNWSEGGLGVDVPDPVVTLMSTVPRGSGGAVAVTEVALFTVKADVATAPNLTWVTPTKLVPVTVTAVPPPVGPVLGLTAVTVGSGVRTNVNQSAGALTADVPAGVVTVTSTVPVAAGTAAVICVALLTVKLWARTVPKLTAVAPVKLEPVIITEVPPWVDPVLGLTAVTVGDVGVVAPVATANPAAPTAATAAPIATFVTRSCNRPFEPNLCTRASQRSCSTDPRHCTFGRASSPQSCPRIPTGRSTSAQIRPKWVLPSDRPPSDQLGTNDAARS